MEAVEGMIIDLILDLNAFLHVVSLILILLLYYFPLATQLINLIKRGSTSYL